jgi:hypothetical protein
VLNRVLKRRGEIVEVLFNPLETQNTLHFWSNTAPQLPRTPVERIILCGIAFNSKDPDGCIKVLNGLAHRTETEPIIVTHRWPDGYASSRFEIWVPPFDLVERFASELDVTELQLLRLSLVIARQASAQLLREDEIILADCVSDFIHTDPAEAWAALSDNPEAALVRVRAIFSEKRDWLDISLKPDQRGKYHAFFRLDNRFEKRAEKALEVLLARTDPNLRLSVGLVKRSKGTRAYLVRAWPRPTMPSIQWLLDQYGCRYAIAADSWVGRPDAMHLELEEAGLSENSIPGFIEQLLEFVKKVAPCEEGACQPPTALSQAIHIAGLEILRRLDVTRALQLDGSSNVDLYLDPLKARLLIETGNRSGVLRYTLVLTVCVRTIAGAKFLFAHGSFNLQKLESQLMGFLGGISARRSTWLGLIELPSRLRIDTDIESNIVRNLHDILGSTREVGVVSYKEAIRRKMLNKGSIIETALLRSLGAEKASLLVYRQSETIGPSVHYALASAAVAMAIGFEKGKSLEVLDLFSGSGLSARSIVSKQSECRVFCVDTTVTAAEAGVANQKNVIWYIGDAQTVLEALDRRFDLICMDPPHQLLFDFLFVPQSPSSGTLIQNVSQRAPWLVLYPGHISQTDRCKSVHLVLKEYYDNIHAWNVGSERILVAGPLEWRGQRFDTIINRARDLLKHDLLPYSIEIADQEERMTIAMNDHGKIKKLAR